MPTGSIKNIKRKKLIKELVNLCHKMAGEIKISHGGWYESYATTDEKRLVKLSEELKEVQDGKKDRNIR